MAPKIDTDSAVEIKDLRVDYGDFTAVRDLSLNIPRGEVYGIVGPNGAGKSSMLNVISGFYIPQEGEVWYQGARRAP
ncbi:MAG: ATP-binding cassette domain-containing protein, partial [Akkermansiaceae bacterium]